MKCRTWDENRIPNYWYEEPDYDDDYDDDELCEECGQPLEDCECDIPDW